MPESKADLTKRLSVDALQSLQDAATAAALVSAPNAGELQDRASWARGINTVQNWTLANLTATDDEIDAACSRMAVGYGVSADELRTAADYTLTAVKARFA